jgi:hypothetical protein
MYRNHHSGCGPQLAIPIVLLLVSLTLIAAGSGSAAPTFANFFAAETPEYRTGVVLELPPQLRQQNWGGGSCVHASNVNLLRWMGHPDLADWWRKNYSGGEYADRLVQRMEAANLRYAFTITNDTEKGKAFLRWCRDTGRGAGIFYKPSHSINYVGEDAQYVYLLDNNATGYPESRGHYERVPVEEFYRNWQGFGGFAWTLIYSPAPPNPYLQQ